MDLAEQPRLTLLVLAAGMGSRFGGLKQLAGLGPNGETLLDYAVYDARVVGFTKVVFVIRKSFQADFEKAVLSRLPDDLEVELVFQELDNLPAGCAPIEGRTKPWGTGHAVLVAKDALDGPFVAVNADDYYGREAYRQAATFLRQPSKSAGSALELGMVAYPLGKTLSPHGSVSRGICESDEQSKLISITEQTSIVAGATCPEAHLPDGDVTLLDAETPVSMNFFALQAEILDGLEAQFRAFFEARSNEPKAEFYLPASVATMIASRDATVEVMSSPEQWLGVTYSDDRKAVEQRLAELTAAGYYPDKLW
jgi:hypothetical protein|tara:strand:- start:106593 stop:107522 length:930 start_codon:yes stop_codon:yes gene_type:complete